MVPVIIRSLVVYHFFKHTEPISGVSGICLNLSLCTYAHNLTQNDFYHNDTVYDFYGNMTLNLSSTGQAGGGSHHSHTEYSLSGLLLMYFLRNQYNSEHIDILL